MDDVEKFKVGLFVLAFLVFLMIAGGMVQAHELWKNGDPIPAWVKTQCCGPADAHNLPDTDVTVTAQGYLVAGRRTPIPFSQAQPSPDQTFWIFYPGDDPNGTVWCFFAPIPGT